jgi:hypothetical protein
MRGKARKDLGKYELALKDLSASQTIDFDEGTVEDVSCCESNVYVVAVVAHVMRVFSF